MTRLNIGDKVKVTVEGTVVSASLDEDIVILAPDNDNKVSIVADLSLYGAGITIEVDRPKIPADATIIAWGVNGAYAYAERQEDGRWRVNTARFPITRASLCVTIGDAEVEVLR